MVAAVTMAVKEHFQLIERPRSLGIQNGGRLLQVITYFYYFQPLCPSHRSRSVTYRGPTTSADNPPYFVSRIFWYTLRLLRSHNNHGFQRVLSNYYLKTEECPSVCQSLLVAYKLNYFDFYQPSKIRNFTKRLIFSKYHWRISRNKISYPNKNTRL